jgi:hypothetical protein
VSEAIHLSVAEPVAAMRPPGAVIDRGRKAEVGTETAGVSRGVQAGRHRAFERSFERRALLLARSDTTLTLSHRSCRAENRPSSRRGF